MYQTHCYLFENLRTFGKNLNTVFQCIKKIMTTRIFKTPMVSKYIDHTVISIYI